MLNLKTNDLLYLEKLQKDYLNTINYFNDLAEFMEGWRGSLKTNEHFKSETGLNNDLKDISCREKNKTTESFVSRICYYFQSTYGLSTLTNNIITETIGYYVKYDFTEYKGKHDNLTYADVVDYICKRLKINDFDNRKVEDLQTRINDKLHYYWKENRIVEGNDKIKITDYGFYLDYNWNDTLCCLGDNSCDFFKDIASAMNYINTGNLSISPEFKAWLDKVGDRNKKPLVEFFTTHEVQFLGVKSIRFYKNRTVEIKFNNNESQQKFIRVLKGDF